MKTGILVSTISLRRENTFESPKIQTRDRTGTIGPAVHALKIKFSEIFLSWICVSYSIHWRRLGRKKLPRFRNDNHSGTVFDRPVSAQSCSKQALSGQSHGLKWTVYTDWTGQKTQTERSTWKTLKLNSGRRKMGKLFRLRFKEFVPSTLDTWLSTIVHNLKMG